MLSVFVIVFAALILAEFGPGSGLALGHRRRVSFMLVRLLAGAVLITGGLGKVEVPVLALTAMAQALMAIAILRNGQTPRLMSPLRHFALMLGLIFGVSYLSAVIRPDAFASGYWVGGLGADGLIRFGLSPQRYLSILTVISGGLLTIRAGALLIEAVFVSAGYGKDLDTECLPGGGAIIGVLERGIIFFLVLIDQITLIGFLVAAKSFLRLGTVRERRASEYVIIGALSSFAWAVGLGWATKTVLLHL
ncbi:MAG: hypothetical protein CME93_03120 [Hyphomonadaceae bacterium]|nr:hypothetical protein [Hyphomonadaceae bacterium]OUX94400.1 MAG: hypothetical protein CBB77_04705 [Hyphomonas sp. TMED17]CAI8317453.1 MAG: Uncharacterised protein [Hyphomonas sp. TMED17]